MSNCELRLKMTVYCIIEWLKFMSTISGSCQQYDVVFSCKFYSIDGVMFFMFINDNKNFIFGASSRFYNVFRSKGPVMQPLVGLFSDPTLPLELQNKHWIMNSSSWKNRTGGMVFPRAYTMAHIVINWPLSAEYFVQVSFGLF